MPQSAALTTALASLEEIDSEPQAAAMARGLLVGYDARWQSQHSGSVPMKVVEIEKTYQAPLLHTSHKAMRRSRTFTLAGKIDKLVDWDGLTLIDHKTTAAQIEDPAATYWRQLQIDGQPMHYAILLAQNGIRLKRIVWDVIRKPAIRPKQLPAAAAGRLRDSGLYCGQWITPKAFPETIHEADFLELYEARVIEAVTEKPESYFQRRTINYTDADIIEYNGTLWDLAQDLLSTRRHNRHYCNPGACMTFGVPCTYLPICSKVDTPDGEAWQQRPAVHVELDAVKDSANALTNSRIKTYQTCRRKHFYRYELGIEKHSEDESEALKFGSLFHALLDHYWSKI